LRGRGRHLVRVRFRVRVRVSLGQALALILTLTLTREVPRESGWASSRVARWSSAESPSGRYREI